MTLIGSKISGHVSLYNDMVLIDNLRDGFDLYNLTRPYPMRSFPIPTTKYFVRQGAFVDFMRLAVCGSDHGKVYVFDVKSSTLVETLEHGEGTYYILRIRMLNNHVLFSKHLHPRY
jgi:hypothetical protein